MNTTIKTSSEKQLNQICRFVKRNKIYYNITEENGLYSITLFGFKASEIEKFIKDFIKTNHLTKIKQLEPQALAALVCRRLAFSSMMPYSSHTQPYCFSIRTLCEERGKERRSICLRS